MTKKVITIFLICISILSVTVSAKNEIEVMNAVDRLYELKIINGYENEEFATEKNVTRAETAAMIRRLMSSDRAVGEKEKLVGYRMTEEGEMIPVYEYDSTLDEIDLLQQIGIISGYEDGEMRLERNVTYEECIKMLVCMLGYKYDAEEEGGWSVGYIKCGEKLGLLEGIELKQLSEYATRGDVAILINNALYIERKLISEVDLGETFGGVLGRGVIAGAKPEKSFYGVTFKEILSNEDLYEKKPADENVFLFEDEVRKIPLLTQIKNKDNPFINMFYSENGNGVINMKFIGIDKRCDYYIDIDPIYDTEYNERYTKEEFESNPYIMEEKTYRKIENIGPISTEEFTLLNIPRGAYQIKIKSVPYSTEMKAEITFENGAFSR